LNKTNYEQLANGVDKKIALEESITFNPVKNKNGIKRTMTSNGS
jgi:hypothetical protein